MSHSYNQSHPMHSWQIKAIDKSIKKADSKKAKFLKHEKVSDWLNSWGSEKEKGLHVAMEWPEEI